MDLQEINYMNIAVDFMEYCDLARIKIMNGQSPSPRSNSYEELRTETQYKLYHDSAITKFLTKEEVWKSFMYYKKTGKLE